MANPNKAKADQFERDCQDYLRSHGFIYAERRKAGGGKDVGDLYLPGYVIECKNAGQLRLPAWADQVQGEIANATRDPIPPPRGVLFIKRRQAAIGRAFVVEELESWCENNAEGVVRD